MAILAPPPAPPRADLGDDDRLKRLRMRLMQAMATLITVVATGWLCTFGALPAIIGLMIAKHVLVAIYLAGLGIDARPGN